MSDPITWEDLENSKFVTKDECFANSSGFIEKIASIDADMKYVKKDIRNLKRGQRTLRREMKEEFRDTREVLIEAQAKKMIWKGISSFWGHMPKNAKVVIYILLSLLGATGIFGGIVSALG